MDVIRQNHLLTHTYTDAFAIYSIQKLWSTYYYASTYDIGYYNLENNLSGDCSQYEILLLDCLSIDGLRIQLDGATKTRLDKLQEIACFQEARNYLHVCTVGADNCGVCEKCRRTLLDADAAGVLEQFSKTLPIDRYTKNRKEYFEFCCKQHVLKNRFYNENYDILYRKHKDEFDLYIEELSQNKLLRRLQKTNDWLNRWRKYSKTFKETINSACFQRIILDYFRENRIDSIAFYGDGELRRYLMELLKGTSVEIKYLVEDGRFDGLGVPTFSRIREDFSDVGAVIITDVMAGKRTKEKIKRTTVLIDPEDLFSKYTKYVNRKVRHEEE